MDKLVRYSREREVILYCLRNERRLTSKQISEETNIKPYKVRKHLKTLLENNVIERKANWCNQFSYTWLYKLKEQGND